MSDLLFLRNGWDFVMVFYEKYELCVLLWCCFSEEEAIKKIYNVSCERYFGFGCEIDEETSNKLESMCDRV